MLYEQGRFAVDLFFLLSGFVFFWLYANRVHRRKISSARFALLRLSRLYPLHLVTLLTVAAGQYWFVHTQGGAFVYHHNDPRHFVMNLFLASSCGLEKGFSFNGPAWTISVEAVLYAVFFAYCTFLPVRARFIAPISGLAFALMYLFRSSIARGIGAFFLGGCVLLAYKAIRESGRFEKATRYAGDRRRECLDGHGCDRSVPLRRGDGSCRPLDSGLARRRSWPVTSVCLMVCGSRSYCSPFHARTGTYGDAAWRAGEAAFVPGRHLLLGIPLHFPLQILSAAVVMATGTSTDVYYSLWFMLAFLAALMLISFGSHRYFEMPVQERLRRRSAASRLARGLPDGPGGVREATAHATDEGVRRLPSPAEPGGQADPGTGTQRSSGLRRPNARADSRGCGQRRYSERTLSHA